jgi:hypothetical protein
MDVLREFAITAEEGLAGLFIALKPILEPSDHVGVTPPKHFAMVHIVAPASNNCRDAVRNLTVVLFELFQRQDRLRIEIARFSEHQGGAGNLTEIVGIRI